MIDFLSALDTRLFLFMNTALSNPVGDALWPAITFYDRFIVVRIVLAIVWVVLIVKGGARGRTVALLVIPLLVLSDQLSSAVLKELVGRPRPCHMMDGQPIVQGIHLLVNCGSGKSFPSSHAVNNFALATLFSFYYRRWTWAFMTWASLVALSRVAVGVHYPSDILGGAVIGALIAAAMLSPSWASIILMG